MDRIPGENDKKDEIDQEGKLSWRKLKSTGWALIVGVLLMMGLLLMAWVAIKAIFI